MNSLFLLAAVPLLTLTAIALYERAQSKPAPVRVRRGR